MNFQEALKNLNQGKKIKRTCWESGHYWVLNGKYKIVNSMEENPIVSKKRMEADDWEVFEEEPCLLDEEEPCLLDKRLVGHYDTFTEHKQIICFKQIDVEEFLRKVKALIINNYSDYGLTAEIEELYGEQI